MGKAKIKVGDNVKFKTKAMFVNEKDRVITVLPDEVLTVVRISGDVIFLKEYKRTNFYSGDDGGFNKMYFRIVNINNGKKYKK